jgi:hypothetical protein
MAINPSFSVSQPLGSPSNIILTDTHTGSDGAIAKLRAYVQMWDGTYLVPAGVSTQYNDWALAFTSITLNLLKKDVGVKIVVQWLDSGNVVKYDKSGYFGFKEFNEEFDYGLTQNVASNQLLLNDNNFWSNKSKLRTAIDSGDKAIQTASDIYSAQQCYDIATDLRINAQYYFNINS